MFQQPERSWPSWRWALTGLSALALALCAYLSWHDLVGGRVIGCDGGSACDQVLSSRWSAVAGVLPVSGLAAGAYLAMLVASLFIGPGTAAPVRRMAWGAMLILVGAAAGSAVWFTIVQKWVIGAFCPYCMATHITGLLLAAIVVWRVPRQFDNDASDVAPTNPAPTKPAPMGDAGTAAPVALSVATGAVIAPPFQDSPTNQRPLIGAWPAMAGALVGVVLAGILAACQVGIAPPVVYHDGASQANLPAIDPRSVPMVGPPDARHVVTLLFDYKCPHCQQMHFLLDEAIRQYGGTLAFALCPTPLSRECNPHIPRDVDEFKDSCELAKIGLAVWVAKREAFGAFDRWMFSMESGDAWRPRSPDAARGKAVELVGQAKFDAASADPWIEQYLQNCIQHYGDTGGSGVPKLLFGSRWVMANPYDADELVSILSDSLAVPRP